MSDVGVIIACILFVGVVITPIIFPNNEVDELRQQVDSLTVVCDSLERELVVDTLVFGSEIIVFEGKTEVHAPIIFEQPVTFDSTVIFRDSVSFGYGGVSFVEPPLAAYD